MKELKDRILQISYDKRLSHLGSTLSCVDIIDAIYSIKLPQDKFILSNGHAALALYCVLEKYHGLDAEMLFEKHGVHPNKDKECGIDCSTGSLGQGLPIAVGMALADRSRKVYCTISDGECSEGSVWEALRIADEEQLNNLKVVCNMNGWGAYKEIEEYPLRVKFAAFGFDTITVDGHDTKIIASALLTNTTLPRMVIARTKVDQYPFLKGQGAHYYTMKKEDYESIVE